MELKWKFISYIRKSCFCSSGTLFHPFMCAHFNICKWHSSLRWSVYHHCSGGFCCCCCFASLTLVVCFWLKSSESLFRLLRSFSFSSFYFLWAFCFISSSSHNTQRNRLKSQTRTTQRKCEKKDVCERQRERNEKLLHFDELTIHDAGCVEVVVLI